MNKAGSPNIAKLGKIQMMKWRWANFGSLYGDDRAERIEIRDECEAHGIPMGYGRVGNAPTQLDDEYLPPLFTSARD